MIDFLEKINQINQSGLIWQIAFLDFLGCEGADYSGYPAMEDINSSCNGLYIKWQNYLNI